MIDLSMDESILCALKLQPRLSFLYVTTTDINKSNPTGATSGAETTNPPGTLDLTPGFVRFVMHNL